MHELYELKEKLLKALTEYNQNNKFSKDDAEAMKYLASTIDHMCNIVKDMEEEYSERGGSYYSREGGGGSGNRRSSYEGGGSSEYSRDSYGGGSYARGRGRNARRDSMGRYSSEGGRYSREGGYSRGEDMIAELKELMMDADDEQMKSEFQRFIKKIENM